MNPKLKKIVDEVKEDVKANPPNEVDDSTILMETILLEGLGTAFSEDDMIEAGLQMGVPKDGIPEFLERFASYIPK